ncbi:MAG: FAD-binding oxidoreductase [Hyphomicrobiaceae bacterium]
MAPVPDRVPSDAERPSRVDTVVVGGGIIGVSTALELAERGVSVALLEKGEIAAEQSSRNWGWCRQMGRDPREIPLIVESLKSWRGMNARIGAETGYRQTGILYLAETEAELQKRAAWLDYAREYQLDSRLIRGEEVERMMPGATRSWKGALYTPTDGRAEPTMAAPAMARHLKSLGASVLTRCAVRGVERSAGRVSSVVTERGRIGCDSVVLAGGAWSRLFCGPLGIDLPQLKVVNSVMRTAPIETGLERAGAGGRFAFRRRLDGGYTVAHRHLSVVDIVPDSFRLLLDFLPAYRLDPLGLRLRVGGRFIAEARLPRRWALDRPSPFEAVRVLDPEPVEWVLKQAAESLKSYFPAFRGMEVVEKWAGAIDATPDAVPVISPVESVPGFYLATGFSGHGFGLGPGAGRLAADLVMGRTPVVDPAPFRFTRFSDGSRPRPITGL